MTTNDKGVRLEDAIAEMIRRMIAVGHQTAWMKTDSGDVFALVTHDPETAAKVYSVLEREGLLCAFGMGRIGEPWTPPPVDLRQAPKPAYPYTGRDGVTRDGLTGEPIDGGVSS
jgi:hypothetical protein